MPPYSVPTPNKSSNALWIVLAFLFVLMIGGIISAILIPAIIARRQAVVSVPIPPVEVAPMPPILPVPPVPPVPGGETASGIDQLKYPNATVEKTMSVAGNEIMIMSTDDDLEEVKKFYQDRLRGATMIDKGGEEVVFTTPGPRATVVAIKPDRSDEDQLRIVVTRTHLPIPNVR